MSDDWLDDLDFETLREPTPVWLASGNTFPHKEGFTSWGWHWDGYYWRIEAEANDPSLLWAERLPGVVVRNLSVMRGDVPLSEVLGDPQRGGTS